MNQYSIAAQTQETKQLTYYFMKDSIAARIELVDWASGGRGTKEWGPLHTEQMGFSGKRIPHKLVKAGFSLRKLPYRWLLDCFFFSGAASSCKH